MFNIKKLLVCVSFVFISSSTFAESCNIPQNIPSPKLAKIDCQNKANVDGYLLSLSWSPQFCFDMRGKNSADVKMQCKDNKFGFIVHGLWPNKNGAKGKCDQPRNCNPDILVNENTIKQNLCMLPSVNLIQGEWQKHGSCAFSKPDDYYATTKKLWNDVIKPDVIALQNSKRNLTVGDVQQAFIKSNPKLSTKNISINMNRGRYLSEVHICYDKNFSYSTCENKGAPAHLSIKVGE